MFDRSVDGDAPAVQSMVGELRDVMRDVQNLAAKFRSEESANLSAAMLWCVGVTHPRFWLVH